MIRTKSIHSPIDPRGDGLRILATRFLGRGLPKLRFDVWMANLGPSETLLKEFQTGKITWTLFRRRYRQELREGGTIDRRNATIENRRLTSWPAIKTDVENAGGIWVDEEVVVDNGLVTSRKPADIPAFSAKVIEEIQEGVHARMVPEIH